jgi:hypothetical protein
MLERARTNPESYRGIYEAMKGKGATASFDEFITSLPQALRHDFPEYKKLAKRRLTMTDMETLDSVSKELGVLCLSKPPDSILMWSYYADKHRGVVFGLDIHKIGGCLSGPSGLVKYRKQRASVDPYLPPGDALHKEVLKTLFTKSAGWTHEKEFRRVFQLSDLISPPPDKDGVKKYFLDISSDAIQEIIFGCRIRDRLKNAICQEIRRRKRTFGHIRLFHCEMHTSKFELKIVPIT